jgi:hypothetical protein
MVGEPLLWVREAVFSVLENHCERKGDDPWSTQTPAQSLLDSRHGRYMLAMSETNLSTR